MLLAQRVSATFAPCVTIKVVKSSKSLPFLTLGMMLACGGGQPAADAPSLPSRGIAAHRGASATHPENTLAAISEALRLGVHQIEIDVRMTSDGRLVLMHDETLSRTTDVQQRFPEREDRRISAYTLEELRTLDAGSWKAPRFAGERVPTLAEALQAIPPQVWINLDVKGERALGAAVAREVLRLDRERQAFLSLRGEALDGARQAAAETGRKLLENNMERQSTHGEYVDRTLAGDFEFIQFFHGPFPDPEDIQRLKEAGVRINYCCSNDPEQLRRWLEAGIDFPLTDDAAAAVAVARREGIEPTSNP